MYGQFVAEINKTDSIESSALQASSSRLASEVVGLFSSSRSTRAATVKSF